ncbi:MAG: hypothetical protein ACLUD2_20570 [Clostridium sp.]
MMEIVEMTVDGKEKKLDRIIEVYEDKAVIQVFESTENMALRNTSYPVSPAIPWRSACPPICWAVPSTVSEIPSTAWDAILADKQLDVNGKPLNPVAREYPRNYIRTGISAIDGLDDPDPGTEAADLLRQRPAP